MSAPEPNIVKSSLSRRVSQDGVTVEVAIYRLETEKDWPLEVVNASGTSIVWDDLFPSDASAYEEFERTVGDEGIRTFLDDNNVVPFRR